MHTIYIHINKINNKAYIGQTSCDVKLRWQNGYNYKPCTHFYNAIQKYGWDNFKHIIFATGLTQEEANHMERLLIALYDTTNPKVGYNLRSGGNHSKLSEETKRKMRVAKAKKIYCFELDKVFIGTRDAATELGVNQSSVSKCCRGILKQVGGYHFKYFE